MLRSADGVADFRHLESVKQRIWLFGWLDLLIADNAYLRAFLARLSGKPLSHLMVLMRGSRSSRLAGPSDGFGGVSLAS